MISYSRLENIIALPPRSPRSGLSRSYGPVMSRAILVAVKMKDFDEIFQFLSQQRREILWQDARASFESDVGLTEAKQKDWHFAAEHLMEFDQVGPKRMKGKVQEACDLWIYEKGNYAGLFRKLKKRATPRGWTPFYFGLKLKSAPLKLQKRKSAIYLQHSHSRDIPKIMKHLRELWSQSMNAKNPAAATYFLAQFEWWFFVANPLGRCGASLGDSMSMVLQLKKGLTLRKKFRSMDWEALSRDLSEYVEWRLRQI